MKIAILAYRALPVADPRRHGHFGGLETSAWLTAKGLAAIDGNDVSLIVRYHWPLKAHFIDGVRVVVRWKPLEILRESVAGQIEVTSGFPWLKIRRWKLSLVWKIPLLVLFRLFSRNRSHVLEEDAFYHKDPGDVLLLFGSNLTSARALISLAGRQTRTVLSIQSNNELDPRFAQDANFQNEYGERSEVIQRLISGTTDIVVQTEFQQQRLLELFGRKSIILGNPFDIISWDQALIASNTTARSGRQAQPVDNAGAAESYVLWVGRPDRFHKRPHLIVEVARLCPDIPFLMVLNTGDEDVRREIESSRPSNLTILDQVPFTDMPKLFAHASLFAFTGSEEHEGLPNVLLQAAASSIGIVAYDFVPQVISESGASLVAGGVEQMAELISQLVRQPEQRAAMGKAGRLLMESHLDLPSYCERLMTLLSGDDSR